MNWVKIHGNLLPSFKKGERYSISSVVIANEYVKFKYLILNVLKNIVKNLFSRPNLQTI